MQAILDFISFLWSGISQAAAFTVRILGIIPRVWVRLVELFTDIPWWISLPALATLVVAVVLQIISFIPTESGGNS